MSDSAHHVAAVRCVRAALEHTADALAGARLDDLLAAEQGLAQALAALSPADRIPVPETEREPLREELARLRAVLIRCRRLGLTLTEFVRISSSALGLTAGYDRGGRVPVPTSGHALETSA